MVMRVCAGLAALPGAAHKVHARLNMMSAQGRPLPDPGMTGAHLCLILSPGCRAAAGKQKVALMDRLPGRGARMSLCVCAHAATV